MNKWSAEDLIKLKELYSRADLTINEIAAMMGKSLSSVTSKAKRENIKKTRVVKRKNDTRKSCNKLTKAERKEIIRRISYNLVSLMQ